MIYFARMGKNMPVQIIIFIETKSLFILYIQTKLFLNSSRPNPGRREKINLNLYFHTSLWCLKWFYEGLKDLHKTF